MDKVHTIIALNQVQNHIDNCQYRCTNISSCNAFNWKLEIYNVIESWFNQYLTSLLKDELNVDIQTPIQSSFCEKPTIIYKISFSSIKTSLPMWW